MKEFYIEFQFANGNRVTKVCKGKTETEAKNNGIRETNELLLDHWGKITEATVLEEIK